MTTYSLGVDVGGTFTDFALSDHATGRVFREKCLTTPADPVVGILNGIGMLQQRLKIEGSSITKVAHATTLATNTLIERKGARTGLLATEGFRDVIELGADQRYDIYDLRIEFPEPLVERQFRRGISERMDASGAVLVEPAEAEVAAAVQSLIDAGIESVAIAFLHSYRNGANEERAAAIIAARFPNLDVSVSSRIAPEIREYERTVTAAANAYVQPIVRSYLNRLERSLKDSGLAAPVLVMLSNGGMTTPTFAAEVPVRMLESGPAAGVIAACFAGRENSVDSLLAFDMGGTTAKACFIDSGRPAFTGTFEAARVKPQFRGSGLPLKMPAVEMIEIGAGGGSIARVDRTGLLKVGPTSAGAKPGPVCYGLGGEQPTVTDADLVLGYLDPGHFLGGAMKLDIDAAHRAIEKLGASCGLGLIEAAAGIAKVVNQNMATAIRVHSAERGKDYRNYHLFAFGGAGPVHCYEIARTLGMRSIMAPLGAGTNSALGLLVSRAAIDDSRSYIADLGTVDWREIGRLFEEMRQRAGDVLRDVGETEIAVTRSVEVRFAGQGFELTIGMPDGALGPETSRAIRESFLREYELIYGMRPADLPLEAVTWRLRAAGPDPEIAIAREPEGDGPAGRRERIAYFPEAGEYIPTRVVDRYRLKAGDAVAGPAILEERDSSLVIGPSGRASVNPDLGVTVTFEN